LTRKIVKPVYIVFWAIVDVKHLLLAIIMSSVFSLPLALAFAQEDIEPRAVLNGAEEDNPRLNSTETDIPILEQVSDKGIYKVQLKWPEVPLNPENVFDIQLVFLNASAPEGTTENVPQKETNQTGQNVAGGSQLTVPGILDNPLRIESYDIAIYSDDGTELWKKVNQPGLGGRPGQNVEIANYTGPVTIEVTNIKPGWDTGETATAEDMTDSVKFTATIVPEFPFAAAMLAAGVAATIAMLRWRKQTM
jgi:hypothetical protein